MNNSANQEDYIQFDRVRIMDKVGFAQPVEAFSVLVPKGWKVDGGVLWNQPGTACAGTNMGMKASSPDGKYSFEIMPNYIWGFSSDPQIGQFQRQQQFPKYCSYGEPLNAETYFRQVFAPYDLGNPNILSVTENSHGTQSLQESAAKTRQEMMKYGASQVNFYPSGISANINWNNGQEALVLCGVVVIETFIPNVYNGSMSKAYTSAASERVVFSYPAGEKEKATNMLSVIVGSFRTNTAWKKTVDDFWLAVRTQSNIQHIGRIQQIDEQTAEIGRQTIAAGKENAARMNASMRTWEASQTSQDRIHTDFVKAIKEVENFQDETGTYEMSSGYNHAWSRGDGSSFLMTDSPNFDPSSVFQDQSWKEMKRVD
ncbi:hypothetical protein GCM10009119_01950 [Algoriphagus jejuensis]|uniref:Uncharacterized protein n=1 Tax=Algoriphagus jejuensis TaxID=419934 RepID=A0ABP3Y8T0_9BACT